MIDIEDNEWLNSHANILPNIKPMESGDKEFYQNLTDDYKKIFSELAKTKKGIDWKML